MTNFWDDLMDSDDKDTADKSDMPDFLRAMAAMIPEYKEMQRYLKRGLDHIVENYEGDVLEKEDEKKLKTKEGTPHCIIVDAAMIDTLDDELMTGLATAVKLFNLTEDPEHLFNELKSLVHYQMHVGMCLGIGMALEDGTLKE